MKRIKKMVMIYSKANCTIIQKSREAGRECLFGFPSDSYYAIHTSIDSDSF